MRILNSQALYASATVAALPVSTSAVLDRLLHHGETVVLEGSSFRMKDRIEKE